MLKELIEQPIYKNFVAPVLCKDLVQLGFTQMIPYQWNVYPATVVLNTHAFDIDEYYKAGQKHIDSIVPVLERIPAYSIMDVDTVISGYSLIKDPFSTHYIAHTIYTQNIYCKKAVRAPDALALLLIELIINKVLNVKNINCLVQHK